jgi:aromatic-L-amino-acid decarboxylase
MSSKALDPSADEIRRLGAEAVEWVARYAEEVWDLPIYPQIPPAPQTLAEKLDADLTEPLPREGRDFAELLATFRDVIVPGSRHNGHPRFFGYVSAPGTAVASAADLLASALNSNLTSWRSAPAPTQVERLTIDWIRQALGCPAGTGGLFLSGGSMANLTALAAARYRHCGERVAAEGAAAHPARLRLYASQEVHHSIDKAAALLGIGHANVRRIAVDSMFRMDVDDLERQVDDDRAAGHHPFCVVASAGTVVTGAIDPLEEIARFARREDLWMHVDACYGGFARLAPSACSLLEGLAEADSIALDPHKWLYLPADCGCLLYREPTSVSGAFALGADYTRILAQGEHASIESFAFWDHGPELSRRFRALKVWMVMASAGARAIGEAIESNLDCARYFAGLIEESDDFELMAPVELSIFCFRHCPSNADPSALDLDEHNEKLLVALQHDGSSYLSNASIHGRFALRGCVLNYRTTRADMERLLEDLRRVAAALPG